MTLAYTELPTEIQYVWHGVNDEANLRHFLGSPVEWAEIDVNWHEGIKQYILRHDSFDQLPRMSDERDLLLADALPLLVQKGKSIKIDFKVGGDHIGQILAMMDQYWLPQRRLWINADLDILGKNWIEALAKRYPEAIIQVPINSVVKLGGESDFLRLRLEQVATWGVNRWSIGWHYPDVPGLVESLRSWGYEVNVYGVEDLAQFLAAVALAPAQSQQISTSQSGTISDEAPATKENSISMRCYPRSRNRRVAEIEVGSTCPVHSVSTGSACAVDYCP